MRQLVRVLSAYSADLFGVNSVLYELGGLVIMHDASGCNSTYNTHDEPRWYKMDSMIYISGLIENDVILGNDQKLIDDVCRAAEETHPRFIAISAALIPLFMATDMKGISRIIESRTGIPTFGFTTNAMDTYVSGGNMVYRSLLERFCRDDIPAFGDDAGADEGSGGASPGRARWTPESGRKLSVNLIGVTPLDFSIVGNVEALVDFFEDRGIEVNACLTTGLNRNGSYERCTIDSVERAGRADVNVLCSSLAEDGAAVLREKYDMPCVTGLPVGRSACAALEELVKASAADGLDRTLDDACAGGGCPHGGSGKEDHKHFTAANASRGGTWVIGEVVWASSVRKCLEDDLGMSDVHIVCPSERSCGLLREGDLMSHEEDDLEPCLADASVVIADPIYRRILTKGSGTVFVDVPHEAYSGRMYRSMLPVFIGDGFGRWISDRIEHPVEPGTNDIMKVNRPFAKKHKYPEY